MSVNKPRVLNKHTDLTPKNSVYIGRPSIYGNPHHVTDTVTREEVIAQYEQDLLADPKRLATYRRRLRGKNLVCWCKPLACHGDVLLRLCNDEGSEQ